MTETIPQLHEVDDLIDTLTDVSERVQAQLKTFAERRSQVALPRGLYAQIPGGRLTEVIREDGGCSYSQYTSQHSVDVDDRPVPVTEVSTAAYGSKIELQFSVPGRNIQAVLYDPEELDGIQFYEQEVATDNPFDTLVQRRLKTATFASRTGDQLLKRWDQRAHVRARDPLTRPVILERLREGYLEPLALDGPVEHITTYYDQALGATLAKVVSRGKWVATESTGWVPLDALEFYAAELPKRKALALGLAQYAEKLIATGDRRYMEALNSLLTQTADPRAGYALAHERRVVLSGQIDPRARFVLGQLASDRTLSRVFAPTLDRLDNHGHIHLPASQVQMFDNEPWVIDDETGLATPLLEPWFQTEKDSWSTPIDRCASELAEAPAQSA